MKWILSVVTAFFAVGISACATGAGSGRGSLPDGFADTLESIVSQYPGEIGVALLTDCGDTVTVNNVDKYPLMSVFKLHQSIATCYRLDSRGTSLDSVVNICVGTLNPDTWSPMLKDHAGAVIELSLGGLMRYALIKSDNNASNYLFDTVMGVAPVDSFIATVIPRDCFRLSVTEDAMWRDHSRCYDNHSSPLGVALLIDRLFSDSIVSEHSRNFICGAMAECVTGADRIAAPLAGKKGVTVAHKTGSGFRNADGNLSAHNDAAYVSLPDGRHYILVVLVKDFNGTESEAAAAIARVSAVVYDAVVSMSI